MAVLFAALLKTNGELSTGILDRVLSTRQKLSILKFTAEQAVAPGGTRDVLLDAIRSVQDLLEKRNDLIHGRWGVSENYPEHLVWAKNTFDQSRPHLGYDTQDLARELSKVGAARQSLSNAILQAALLIQPQMINGPPP